MAFFKIGVASLSSQITAAQVSTWIAALQTQVSRDFGPVWGVGCLLLEKAGPGDWPLHIVDAADVKGALGYHDIDSNGTPFIKVFMNESAQAGVPLSAVISHEICLAGDTVIPLLDGTSPTIAELVGRDSFWVYSCDTRGNVVIGKGHNARLTQSSVPVVRVILDSGESITCTSNHRFLMRDGSYRAAAKLSPGDSLMPLYRQYAPIKEDASNEYEQVYIPGKDAWFFTHRIACPKCPSGSVRHHVDFNRFNNSPDNLVVMSWQEHQNLHSQQIRSCVAAKEWRDKAIATGQHPFQRPRTKAQIAQVRARITKYNKSDKHRADMQVFFNRPGVRERFTKRFKRWANSPENLKRLKAMRESAEGRRISSENLTKYNKSKAHRIIAGIIGRRTAAKLWQDAHFRAVHVIRLSNAAKKLNADPQFAKRHAARIVGTNHNRWHFKRGIVSERCQLCDRGLGRVSGKRAVKLLNHKVVSVEPAGVTDVYDLSVEKYHNFAVGSGVFVHNCEVLSDPFVESVVLNDAGDRTGTIYAAEVCDPVEADLYQINGVSVSNFITPRWFGTMPGIGAFDFQNQAAITATTK